MKKLHIVHLSPREKAQLHAIISSGEHKARTIKRAQVLLKSAHGLCDRQIVEHIQIGHRTVQRIRERYCDGGIERAIHDAPRHGAPLKITDKIETHVVAIACSEPPRGAEHWTLELLQERVIREKLLKTVSTVGLWYHLAQRGIKPWREKMWCLPTVTTAFIKRMEDILELYARPYNPQEPVLCFDEKSKQLLEDIRPLLLTRPGRARRIDSEYKRNGTRNIFVTVEPKAGWQRARVTKRRTKVDFAKEFKRIVTLKRYALAETIHIVLDNLNTHFRESLVAAFGAAETDRLLSRVVFHHTPVHASWLNMAEIEIGILDRQCLNRRIPTEGKLKQEIGAWEARRNRVAKTMTWKFTVRDAKNVFKY